MTLRFANRNRFAALAIPAVVAAIAIAGCGGSSDTTTSSSGESTTSASSGGTQLQLVAYSTPKKAYDALTAAYGQTAQGKGVTFSESFGASGTQSRAVDSGPV